MSDLEDLFNLTLIYGGIATGAYLRDLYARASPGDQEAVVAAWRASFGIPGRRRVVAAACRLTGRPAPLVGADDVAALRQLVTAVAPLAVVNGWGPSGTFDPVAAHAWGLPLLIHAFGAAKQITPGTVIYDLLRDYIDPDLGDFAEPGSVMSRPALKLLTDPGSLTRNIVSASLINEAKRPSAGVAGYILKAPAWNVIGAYHADANLANDALRAAPPIALARGQTGAWSATAASAPVLLGGDRGRLPDISMQTPTEIMNLTLGTRGASKYNEIALQGTSAFGTTIEVAGIFIKVRQVDGAYRLLDLADNDLREIAPTMFLYSDGIIAAMRAALQRGVPFVAIVDDADDLFPGGPVAQIGDIGTMTLLA